MTLNELADQIEAISEMTGNIVDPHTEQAIDKLCYLVAQSLRSIAESSGD